MENLNVLDSGRKLSDPLANLRRNTMLGLTALVDSNPQDNPNPVPASPAVAKAREMAENLKPNKFDTIISIAFTYTEGGRWHSIDVNFREYLIILQTGMVDDKQICAVEVSDTDTQNEEGDRIKMVYDFVLLHTERNPWRMV